MSLGTSVIIPGWPAYRIDRDGNVWTRWFRYGQTKRFGDWRPLSPEKHWRITRYKLCDGRGNYLRWPVQKLIDLAFGSFPKKGVDCGGEQQDRLDGRDLQSLARV